MRQKFYELFLDEVFLAELSDTENEAAARMVTNLKLCKGEDSVGINLRKSQTLMTIE